MASLTRRLPERSVSLGILPFGWLAVIHASPPLSYWAVTDALAGQYPGRQTQRYRLWEERGER